VKTEEEERTTSSINKSPPFVLDTIEIEPSTNMLDDGDIWIEVCSKMQFNSELRILQHREFFDLLQEFQDVFAWHKGELGTCNMGEHSIDT
jgi:hypothetical protein